MDWDDIFDDDRHNDGRINEEFIARVDDIRGLSSPLASEESTRISLQYIREQRDGLNKHRQSLLNRVPEQEQWAVFSLESIEDKDLAYLSAATGDEFALLRGKNQDILYRGTWPDFKLLLVSFGYAILFLVVGFLVFEKLKRRFAEEI